MLSSSSGPARRIDRPLAADSLRASAAWASMSSSVTASPTSRYRIGVSHFSSRVSASRGASTPSSRVNSVKNTMRSKLRARSAAPNGASAGARSVRIPPAACTAPVTSA